MKVRASVKKRSADCKIVKRKGRVYVINKENPKKPGCKGQCHLKAQLEKSRPEHDSESGILPQIETSMFLLMFAPQESAGETLTLNKKCSNSAQKKSYLENFETDIFHPPKA